MNVGGSCFKYGCGNVPGLLHYPSAARNFMGIHCIHHASVTLRLHYSGSGNVVVDGPIQPQFFYAPSRNPYYHSLIHLYQDCSLSFSPIHFCCTESFQFPPRQHKIWKGVPIKYPSKFLYHFLVDIR